MTVLIFRWLVARRRSALLVVVVLLGAVARPAAATTPNSRLLIEIVQPDQSASAGTSVPGDDAHASADGPRPITDTVRLSMAREPTGEIVQSIPCRGRCEVTALPPGRYRLIAESLDGVQRSVISGIPVDDHRVLFIQVDWRPGRHEVKAEAYLMPASAINRAGTRVTIISAGQKSWTLVDACTVTDPSRLSRPGFWIGRDDEPFHGSQFWGEDNKWWGGLTGVMRDPAGAPASRVPVTLEYLDRSDIADTVFHTTLRATTAGCYGLHGLWPGRYRLVVDYPPFVVAREIEVRHEGVVRPTKDDVALAVAPEREPEALPPLRTTYSGRLGRFSSLDELLRIVDDRAPVIQKAIDAGTLAPADLAVVEGVVAWQHADGWKNVHRVPGVRVVFERDGMGDREVVTDAEGYYRLSVPAGRYRLRVEQAPFEPMSARVLVLPEGHAVLESGGFKTSRRSGVYFPSATLRSGLMTSLHVGLVRPIDETTDSTSSASSAVTVQGSGVPQDIAPPLGGIVSRHLFDIAGGLSASPDSLQAPPLASGRTVQSFHHLFAGLVYTEQTGNLAQFTAVGQRRYANRMTIDGMSADLAVDLRNFGIGEGGSGALPAFAASGGTQTLAPLTAVEDIQIRTTQAKAEHARTPGAQTAIVTRAGTDRFSGSAFADLRPEALSATDFFDNASGTRRARQFSDSGLSLGGPLRLPRTNYWLAYEGQSIDRSVWRTFPVPSLAVREAAPDALRPLLNAYPLPNGPELNGEQAELYGEGLAELSTEVPATSTLSVLSARVDTNGSGRHRLFVRGSHGRSKGDLVTQNRQFPLIGFDATESTATTSVTAGVTSIGSSVVHDFRGNVMDHRGGLTHGTASYGGAQPLLAGVLTPRTANGGASARLWMFPGESGSVMNGRFAAASQRQVQLIDTWTFLQGKHEWKIGLDYRHVTARTDPAPDRYTYRFDDVPGFLKGAVWPVAIDHYAPAGAVLQTWSAFAQDDFRVSSRLSLHYGLRYSVKPAPTSITDIHPLTIQYETLPDIQPRPTGARLWNTSWTDFAPRAAATYQLGTTAGRETTLRAGWSLAFDELTNPGAVAFGRGFPYRWRRDVWPSTFPVPATELAVSAPSSFAESPIADAYSFASGLSSPWTHQWHVGVDQALGQHQQFAMAYVGAAARHLPYWQAHYLNPSMTHTVHAFSDDASSDYSALLVQYTRRLARALQARIAYTWSRAMDTDSGESEDPNLPISISPVSANHASADFDRRHVLYATASYQLPTPPLPQRVRALLADWHVDIVGRLQSGAPVTIQAWRDFGPSGYYVARPDTRPGAAVWLDDLASPTGRRINAAAFSIPEEPRQGTHGRNLLRGSPFQQMDLSLVRSIRLGEGFLARVRLDVFNVFNIPNFGPPEGKLAGGRAPFGMPYQSHAHALGTGTLAFGGLPAAQQAGAARAIQLGVSLGW